MDEAAQTKAVYLKQQTKIEPLCCGWYAWSHLIAPVQLALNVTFRQIPLLKSFIANPALHEAALDNIDFLGGSFVHLKRGDVAAARKLLQDMSVRCAPLVQLANDFASFDRLLQANAKGGSLDRLYSALPESLCGAVEIAYDLNSHPMLRVIEEFFYERPNSVATQELYFFQRRDEERKFFLNTPRLQGRDEMVVPIPFCDPRLDVLAQSRVRPVPFFEIVEALQVQSGLRQQFAELFTETPPTQQQPTYTGDGLRVRYFGHACVLVQTSQASVLIDPLFAWDNDDESQRLVFNDLPDFIDYVFITHNHHDHFCPEFLLQLRNRIGRILVPRNNVFSVCDSSMKLILKALGFSNVVAMDELETVGFCDGFIASVPFYGEHANLSVSSKHGMYLRARGKTLAFLADSNCLDRMLYRRVARRFGKADVLFIGMECRGAPLTWIYGPYLTNPITHKDDESRRSNGSDAEAAWALLEELGCSRAFLYAMGQEPWLRYLLDLVYTPDSQQIVESNKFLARCAAAGIEADRLNGCREMIF